MIHSVNNDYSINQLIYVLIKRCVLHEVRTEFLILCTHNPSHPPVLTLQMITSSLNKYLSFTEKRLEKTRVN